jgi:transposase-like protein
MIRTSQVHHCRACGSTHIVKNGRNRSGSQQYQCRTCRASKVLFPKQRYSEERKGEVLRAYQERSSLRGLNRTFGITRKTITQWLKKTPTPARRVLRPRDPFLLQERLVA